MASKVNITRNFEASNTWISGFIISCLLMGSFVGVFAQYSASQSLVLPAIGIGEFGMIGLIIFFLLRMEKGIQITKIQIFVLLACSWFVGNAIGVVAQNISPHMMKPLCILSMIGSNGVAILLQSVYKTKVEG